MSRGPPQLVRLSSCCSKILAGVTPLRDAMAQHGIETGLYFPSIATFTPYDEAPAAALPVTDQISPRMLALPLHPRLKPAQIDEVVATLEESLGRIRLEG